MCSLSIRLSLKKIVIIVWKFGRGFTALKLGKFKDFRRPISKYIVHNTYRVKIQTQSKLYKELSH